MRAGISSEQFKKQIWHEVVSAWTHEPFAESERERHLLQMEIAREENPAPKNRTPRDCFRTSPEQINLRGVAVFGRR